MTSRFVSGIAAALLVLLASAACTNTPSQPSSTTTASITAPRPLQPGLNAQMRFVDQPVTLAVQNALVTQSTARTYSFEVATDPSFSSKVQTKDNVAEGNGSQTSVRLDALPGARDYYWRARAIAGGTTSPFSATYKFTINAPVTIDAPIPIGPLDGATTLTRPAFRVKNAARSGPTGPLTYRFEVSTNSSFAAIIMSATQQEGVNETGCTPPSALPVGATLYWRATAIDAANAATSAPSATESFTTRAPSQAEAIALQEQLTLWPDAQPPGTFGHATMGDGWGVTVLHHVPTNTTFQSPTLEMLQLFDLLDRGFDPNGAISWMNANGYPTAAMWYPPPEKAVIGLAYVYLAAVDKVVVNGTWALVLKAE